MDLPHRYDLLGWSCVSEAVHSTNKQLKDLTKNYSNVKSCWIQQSRKTNAHPSWFTLEQQWEEVACWANLPSSEVLQCRDPNDAVLNCDYNPRTVTLWGACYGKLSLSITQQPSLRKPLTMFQLNIQSIRNKLDLLNLWFDKYTCNILT